jgi:hypothetical protein
VLNYRQAPLQFTVICVTIFNAEQTIVGLQRTCHSDPLLGKNNQVAKSIDISLHEPLFQPQSTITCVEGTVQEQQHTNNKKGTTSLLQQKTIKKMIQKWGGEMGNFQIRKDSYFTRTKNFIWAILLESKALLLCAIPFTRLFKTTTSESHYQIIDLVFHSHCMYRDRQHFHTMRAIHKLYLFPILETGQSISSITFPSSSY